MLWGSAMGLGAESNRRCTNQDKAIALAIKATQHVMESFTDCIWQSKASMAKYIVSGKVMSCFKLAENWAPEAIKSAYEGLSYDENDLPESCISCASEVAKKMGATDEEIVMVAGFAGGIGLSGNACGALGAAIWMKTLALCKKQPGKSFYSNPDAKKTLDDFYLETDYKILCDEITETNFKSLNEHTEFIKKGGCSKLIDVLADTNSHQ